MGLNEVVNVWEGCIVEYITPPNLIRDVSLLADVIPDRIDLSFDCIGCHPSYFAISYWVVEVLGR